MGKKKFASDRPSFDEIRALRKPRLEPVWVPIDGSLLSEISRLEQAVVRAEQDDDRLMRHANAEAPRLREQLAEARIEAEDAAVEFVFTEVPRRVWRALMAACPAYDDAGKRDASLRFDEKRFGPVALAATCVQPELCDRDKMLAALDAGEDLDQFLDRADEIWTEWGNAVATVLYGTALLANEQLPQVPFGGPGSKVTRGSGLSSTSAAAPGSPTPSS